MNTISLTVPMDYNALTRASDMLHGLALDLNKEAPTVPDADIADNSHIEAQIPVSEGGTKYNDGHGGVSDTPVVRPTEEPLTPTTPAEAFTEGNEPAAAPPPPPPAIVPSASGVDLDSDGFPWDSRIHSGSKTKLKKTQQWKKARNVDPALVTTVEAELKAAMAAPAPNAPPPATVAASDTTTPSTVVPPPPPVAVPATPPPPPPAATGGITTLPELMVKITSSGVDQTVVLAAANKLGLASIALLGARPDLIPTVAAELFPGG